jgi:hypothetical protein
MDQITEEVRKPKRVKMTVSVSENTIKRLETLATRLELPNGRVIDNLVWWYWSSIATKRLRCINGDNCRYNLPME